MVLYPKWPLCKPGATKRASKCLTFRLSKHSANRILARIDLPSQTTSTAFVGISLDGPIACRLESRLHVWHNWHAQRRDFDTSTSGRFVPREMPYSELSKASGAITNQMNTCLLEGKEEIMFSFLPLSHIYARRVFPKDVRSG
jgi:hypothetical protein